MRLATAGAVGGAFATIRRCSCKPPRWCRRRYQMEGNFIRWTCGGGDRLTSPRRGGHTGRKERQAPCCAQAGDGRRHGGRQLRARSRGGGDIRARVRREWGGDEEPTDCRAASEQARGMVPKPRRCPRVCPTRLNPLPAFFAAPGPSPDGTAPGCWRGRASTRRRRRAPGRLPRRGAAFRSSPHPHRPSWSLCQPHRAAVSKHQACSGNVMRRAYFRQPDDGERAVTPLLRLPVVAALHARRHVSACALPRRLCDIGDTRVLYLGFSPRSARRVRSVPSYLGLVRWWRASSHGCWPSAAPPHIPTEGFI